MRSDCDRVHSTMRLRQLCCMRGWPWAALCCSQVHARLLKARCTRFSRVNISFVCLFQSEHAPSSSLELGISLDEGANCASVSTRDRCGRSRFTTTNTTPLARTKFSVCWCTLAAENLCKGWFFPSLLSCSATSGKGACTVLLYRLMDGKIAAHLTSSLC